MIPSDRLHPDSTAMGPHSHDKRAYNGSNHHQGIFLIIIIKIIITIHKHHPHHYIKHHPRHYKKNITISFHHHCHGNHHTGNMTSEEWLSEQKGS